MYRIWQEKTWNGVLNICHVICLIWFLNTKNGYQTAHLNLEREKCIKSLVGSPGNTSLCMGKKKLLERKNSEHL